MAHSPHNIARGYLTLTIMKRHVFLIIVTICCALSWPSTSCYAQGFTKAARTAFHSIRANKAMVTTKATRDFTVQERQRRQIQQRAALKAFPPVSTITHMRHPIMKPISAATLKATVISKQLPVLVPPVRIDSLINTTHFVVAEKKLLDSTAVGNNDNE